MGALLSGSRIRALCWYVAFTIFYLSKEYMIWYDDWLIDWKESLGLTEGVYLTLCWNDPTQRGDRVWLKGSRPYLTLFCEPGVDIKSTILYLLPLSKKTISCGGPCSFLQGGGKNLKSRHCQGRSSGLATFCQSQILHCIQAWKFLWKPLILWRRINGRKRDGIWIFYLGPWVALDGCRSNLMHFSAKYDHSKDALFWLQTAHD